MANGAGNTRRFRDFPNVDTISAEMRLVLDGDALAEAGSTDLTAFIDFLLPYVGGGGGGGTAVLANTGTGAQIYSGNTGLVANIRSLKSGTSALSIVAATGSPEVTFTINLATSALAGLMSAADKAKLDTYPPTLGPATSTNAGTMSAADKTKLDGLPGSIPVASAGNSGLMSATDKVKLDAYPATPPGVATQSTAGLMSAGDKTKLDAIPANIVNATAANVGAGQGVWKQRNGTVDEFKSLRSNSSALAISAASDELLFSIQSATQTAPGLMSAADKLKLDTLEDGGGGPGPTPVAPYEDLTINNGTFVTVSLASDTPDGAWFILADASDVEMNAIVIVDFANAVTSLYTGPGKGTDLIGAYGLIATATGALTGSNGTANKINVSCMPDYTIYINNRTGTNKVIRFFQAVAGSGGGAITLTGLADVNITSLVNGYVLTYDQTSGKWIAAPPTGGGGGGPLPTDPEFNSVTIGDAESDTRSRLDYIVESESFQIGVAGVDDSSLFEIFADGDIQFNGVSLKPSLDLTNTLAECVALRDETRTLRDEANSWAQKAKAWAINPVGQPIEGTSQSSYAYSQQALATAEASRVIPTRVIADSDLVSGAYTLKSGDLFTQLNFQNTSACNIICPPNLWRTNIGEAWVIIRREGALVTAIAANSVVTAPLMVAKRSIIQRFGTPPTSAVTTTEVLNIPQALVNAKVAVVCHTVHAIAGASKSITLSSSKIGSSPQLVWNDTSFTGGNEALKQTHWQWDLANLTSGDCPFTMTFPAQTSAAVAFVYAVNNAGTREDTNYLKSSGVASSIATSLMTNAAGRLVIMTAAQRSNNGVPIYMTGGLYREQVATTIGVSPGGTDDRFTNICAAFGTEAVPALIQRNYQAQFNQADGPCSAVIWAFPPVTTASVSSIVRAANGDPTIPIADGVASLQLNPDGLTYFWNAG